MAKAMYALSTFNFSEALVRGLSMAGTLSRNPSTLAYSYAKRYRQSAKIGEISQDVESSFPISTHTSEQHCTSLLTTIASILVLIFAFKMTTKKQISFCDASDDGRREEQTGIL
jgi:hypothetical protein